MLKKALAPPPQPEAVTIAQPEPACMQDVGGPTSGYWNARLLGNLVAAIPGGLDPDQRHSVIQAVTHGQRALTPADPVEAMLAGRMIAAHESALEMRRRAWLEEQTWEARTKYLALADKAVRTVAVLAETLDRHRRRGQQQITVKHVTVNADQAVVADQVVTAGRGGNDSRT